MNNGLKLAIWALVLCAAAFALDMIAIVVVAVAVSDQSMQAAERAVVFLLGFECVVALAAAGVFWRLARDLALAPRLFATLAMLIPQALVAVAMAFFSMLALNR